MESTSNTATHSQSHRPKSLTVLIEDILTAATKRSKETTPDGTVTRNCPYNACAVASVLHETELPTRVIRGGVVDAPSEIPESVSGSLSDYLINEGDIHWWVEAKLTPDTWWTLDIWSIHPARDDQPLVMAGRPPEYIVESVDPPDRDMFQPER